MRVFLYFALILSSISTLKAQGQGWLGPVTKNAVKPNSSSSSSSALVVRIRDKCDPVTFNLALQDPNACVGDGNVTFDAFIAELTEDQKVGAWRFNPDNTDGILGQQIRLESRGGETHTFTKVDQFGGGFIAFLNALSGNTEPAHECGAVAADGSIIPDTKLLFVPVGKVIEPDKTGLEPLSGGEHKFQCCIHPWMRLTVNVKDWNQGTDGGTGK
jgi:hypothetical protein